MRDEDEVETSQSASGPGEPGSVEISVTESYDPSTLAVAIADLDGRLVQVNDAFVALWRLGDREHVLGRQSVVFWQDPDRAASVVRVLRAGGAWRGEMTARRGDGTPLELEVFASMVTGRDGVPLCMLSSFIDVTERKRAAEAARENQEHFRRVFEQGSFAMAMSDRDFRFYRVNQAFCSLFGYTREELSRLTFRELTHPDHLGTDIDNVARLTRGEIPIYQTEKRYLTKAGAVLWGALTVSVLRDSVGNFLHYLVMIENIDQRRRAAKALQDAERLESLAVLAGGIAHDFNNLLLGIFGHVDLARRDLPRDSDALRHLDQAISVSSRARALTQQLLTFAKGGTPKKEPVALPVLLERVTRFALSGSNVASHLSLPDDLWICDADEDQLSRAIENILINARQAMPNGGTLSVSARNVDDTGAAASVLEPGRYVAITIEDRGVGITEQARHHVFDPFFTTKPHGSGLGLATAFSILKRHGGHIELTSVVGEGSTFTLYVPSSTRAIRTGSRTAAVATSNPGLRVLVMDDEPAVREVAVEMLRRFGYRVASAEGGERAIELYRDAMAETPFDVVILDLTVPGGMGGARVLEQLRRLDPAVNAIASSGYSDDPVMARPEQFGFRASLAKPYVGDDLVRAIEVTCPGDRGTPRGTAS